MIDLTTCSKCGIIGLQTNEGRCPNCGTSESDAPNPKRTHKWVSIPTGYVVLAAAWSGFVPQALFFAADRSPLKSTLAVCALVLSIVQAVAFLIWIWRIVKRLQPYDKMGQLPQPGDTIIGFFIPLFNLYWLPAVFFRIDRFLRAQAGESHNYAIGQISFGFWALVLMLVTVAGTVLAAGDRTGSIELTTRFLTSLFLTGLVVLMPRDVETTGRPRFADA